MTSRGVLLSGHLAREARDAVGSLSRRLRASPSNGNLQDGAAGVALAHAALESVCTGRGHAEHAQRALRRAVHNLATADLGPSLFNGFTGVAWVTEVLAGTRGAAGDLNANVDDALERYLGTTPWREPYDLFVGLVGLGVYALERMPRPSAKRLTARLVRRLAETARRRDPGLAWRSDPNWVPPRARETPHPEWNLGVAHGVPGVIAVLGRICASPCDAPTRREARTLLDGAVAWLFSQRLPAGSRSCYPAVLREGGVPIPAPLAWCYGDPGIAATLLVAARAVGEPAWEREAMRLGLRAAAGAKREGRVREAGLCHGTAGLAHLFHRLYRTTGEERFARAARTWFARTLALCRSRGHRRGRGFLTGSAGVTLALAAALSGDEPRWDRALLLS
jgi:lantibiotic modifying enzyme